MKLFLIFLMTVLLNQISYATGAKGEDPNMAMARFQSGTTFISAVGPGDQPAYCATCEVNDKAMRSNNIGVINTATGSSLVDSSGTPVVDSSGKPVEVER